MLNNLPNVIEQVSQELDSNPGSLAAKPTPLIPMQHCSDRHKND